MSAAFPDLRTSHGVAGELVYAVGDVHGRYDLLKMLLADIAEDSARRARGRRPILIFCGDYVDRGPESAKVLAALAWMRTRQNFEVHLLKGNHEQGLLDFIEAPADSQAWLRYGGAATLASYGAPAPTPEDPAEAFERARDALLEAMPASHLRLLQGLELMLTVGDYVFVHAGVRPGASLTEQDPRDLLWIRSEFLECEDPFEKVVVHGHTWLDDRPRILGHRLAIDTGAYATGALTAVRLEDGEVGVLQARIAEAAAPDLALIGS